MARIKLTDTNWVDLSTLTSLDDGSKYFLQACSDEDLKFPADIIYTKADTIPTELNDGVICSEVRFSYDGTNVYIRATGLPCNIKVEGV